MTWRGGHESWLRWAALLLAVIVCSAFSRVAARWRDDSDRFAVSLAVRDLPGGTLRDFYQTNIGWLETNSSFPDRWLNRGDAAEPARHYLYVERFGVSTNAGQIPSGFADVDKRRTYDQLRSDGILPWTVLRHYKLLVCAFRDRQWDAAMFESAMLSHYAADAHVPLRATEKGSGQLSTPPQPGVLLRFEDGIVERGIRAGDLRAGTPSFVSSPAAKTLDILKNGLPAVPVLLAADARATTAAGGSTQGTVYWNAFGHIAQPIAVDRLNMAGRTISGLFLAAWQEAGQPVPPANFLMTDRFLPYAPPLAAPGEIPGPALPAISDEAKDVARDAAIRMKVTSKLLGRDIDATVLLPADYERSRLRYPVLYVLHGSSGNENDWLRRSGIAAFVRPLRLIVVMPDAGDSWYVNSTGKGPYEDFFVKELIPAIDSSFRTLPRREARAVAGNSMGGYGAWRLALDNNSLFVCAASISGALDMGVVDPHDGEPHDWITTLYGNDDAAAVEKYHQDDLYRRIDRLTRRGQWRGPYLYFDAGADDYLLSGDHHMEQYLLERALPYEYAEFPGSHDWSYWDEHIRDVLQFTRRHLAAPALR